MLPNPTVDRRGALHPVLQTAWGLSKRFHTSTPSVPSQRRGTEAIRQCHSSIKVTSHLSALDMVAHLEQCQGEWIDRHLPPLQAGARRGRDAASTFVEVASRYAQGHYVGSLDLTKAFDHIRPSAAVGTLVWYGWPSNLVQAISQVCGAQNRWFSWWGFFHQGSTLVTSSIPQGDALSPTVMNFLLAAPMRHISQQCPESQLFGYVDDRSWTSPTALACKTVFDLWHEHSPLLGLVENPGKLKSPKKHLREDANLNSFLNCVPTWSKRRLSWVPCYMWVKRRSLRPTE